MIKMLRIDDRLIHGQIAGVWSKELGVDRIVVANDKVAVNDVQKATLKMAAPAMVKCSILSVEDACDIFNDPRAASMKILAIVNNTDDARRICEKVTNVNLFNVGNYGLISGDVAKKRKVGDTFYVDDHDVENLKAIVALGIPSVYQLVPTNPVRQIKDLI